MSLSKVKRGAGVGQNWSLELDGIDIEIAGYGPPLAPLGLATPDGIFIASIAASTNAALTYDSLLVSMIGLDGTVVWTKAYEDSTADMRFQYEADDHQRKGYMKYYQSAGVLAVSAWGTHDWLFFIDTTDGTVDRSVDLSGLDTAGFDFLSNGDLAVYDQGGSGKGELVVLDRSAATSYTSIVSGQSLAFAGADAGIRDIAVDGSDKIWICGSDNLSNDLAILLGVTTGGTVDGVSINYTGASGSGYCNQVLLDGSGNLYLLWDDAGNLYFTKFNSSKVEQYTRQLSGTGFGHEDIMVMNWAPDESTIYISKDNLVLGIDPSDGTESVELSGAPVTAGEWHDEGILNHHDGAGYTGICAILGVSAGNGLAVLKIDQTSFEAGGTFGDYVISSGSALSSAAETQTTEDTTPTTSTSAHGVTPSNFTSYTVHTMTWTTASLTYF